jgi:hypothetical protein
MAGFKGGFVKVNRQNAKVKNMNSPDEVAQCPAHGILRPQP